MLCGVCVDVGGGVLCAMGARDRCGSKAEQPTPPHHRRVRFVDRTGELRPARPSEQQRQQQQQVFTHLPAAARAVMEQQQAAAADGVQNR